MAFCQGSTQLKGQCGANTAHAGRQRIPVRQCMGYAAGQTQKAFLREHGLVERVVADGGFKADIAFIGQP